MSGGGGDKRERFFRALEKEDVKTVRWMVRHGGMSAVRPYSDEQLPPLHFAVQAGRLKSLKALLESIDATHSECAGWVDVRDAGPADRTPLMLAAAGNWLDGVRALLANNASLTATDAKGRTARDYAAIKKRAEVLRVLDEWQLSRVANVELVDEDEDAEARRQKRLEREAEERGVSVERVVAEREKREVAERAARDAGERQAARLDSLREALARDARSDDVRACAQEFRRDLTIKDAPFAVDVDPAVWRCEWLHTLTVRGPLDIGGVGGGGSSTPSSIVDSGTAQSTENGATDAERDSAAGFCLPDELLALASCAELVLRGLRIARLPPGVFSAVNGNDSSEQLGAVLKVLDLAENQLSDLPDTLAQLPLLEVLDVSGNALSSLAATSGCAKLVTLKASRNRLTTLEDVDVASWAPRLETLVLDGNALEALPSEVGALSNLITLDVSNNRLVALPAGLGDLNVKKLQRVDVTDNPIKDRRIAKILEKGNKPIKELLAYVKKTGTVAGDENAGSRRRGGGKAKGKAAKKQQQQQQQELSGDDSDSAASSANENA